jgi:hypothetical protein
MVAYATLWQFQVRDNLADRARSLQQVSENPKSRRIAKPPHELCKKLIAEPLASLSQDGRACSSSHLIYYIRIS